MKENNVKRIVFSSTAATFGEPDSVPISEETPQHPASVYGTTKLMIEKILRDYDAAYGIRSVALRYFNAAGADESGLIGEAHNPETHLIPLIMQVLLGRREHISIYGTCLLYTSVAEGHAGQALGVVHLISGGHIAVIGGGQILKHHFNGLQGQRIGVIAVHGGHIGLDLSLIHISSSMDNWAWSDTPP